jgi:hypothetical protein
MGQVVCLHGRYAIMSRGKGVASCVQPSIFLAGKKHEERGQTGDEGQVECLNVFQRKKGNRRERKDTDIFK